MSGLERIWLAWLSAMAIVAVATPGGGTAGHRPVAFVGLLAALAAVQFAVAAAASRWSVARLRVLRAVVACAGTPIAFSSLGWLLPGVHPEPYEYRWRAFDQAVFGFDPTVALQALLSPWLVEFLQWVYAAFYVIPIGAALAVAKASGGAAFDRVVTILVGCFLASYAGYLLFPTLGPMWILDHGGPVRGVWLAEEVHAAINAAEANRWDCMPSGHTMLSLCSLIVVWRWARRWFLPLLLVVVPLIAATMCIRYHWTADVLAGALLAWPAVRSCDRLCAPPLGPHATVQTE